MSESLVTMPSSSRFHRPAPVSPKRWPSDPPGTTGSSLRASMRTVRNAAFSSCSWAGRSAAVRNLPAVYSLASVEPVETSSSRHQVRQVGVGLHVVGEVRRLPVDEELLEDHVAHRHRQCGVGAGAGRQPLVGELHVVGVVGRDRDHLLAPVARLGHPVGVGRARHRQVRAPHDQVARVPPVAGLGHVGLVAEHLRRGHRQVGVPVVEAQHRAADEVHEPGPGRVGDHRHRGDRGEARDPGPGRRLADRVHVRGGDDLDCLLPRGADEGRPCRGRPCRPWRAAGSLDDVLPTRAPGRRRAATCASRNIWSSTPRT